MKTIVRKPLMIKRLYIVCCGWLTEDWTNNRVSFQVLLSEWSFSERIFHKRCMGVEIVVVVSCRCSLCWVLKVWVVVNLRLSCRLVCDDSASRRWRLSLCLVQIVGIAVWSGCRCCWIRLMIWTHLLQKLDDRCLGCAVLWLNVCVLMWPWSVGAYLSSVCRSKIRCCRRWLERLCDRCPSLFNPWLPGRMLM